MSSQPRLKDLSFFVSLKRKRLLYAVMQQTFRRLIDTVGIGAEADATWQVRGPSDVALKAVGRRFEPAAGSLLTGLTGVPLSPLAHRRSMPMTAQQAERHGAARTAAARSWPPAGVVMACRSRSRRVGGTQRANGMIYWPYPSSRRNDRDRASGPVRRTAA